MTTVIPYDDLRPDMWVTIRDIPEEEDADFPFEHPGEAMRRMRRHRPCGKPRPGVPMRVLSVDLPFIYLAVLDGDGDEVGPLIMDLREQPVVGLDESVANSIVAFGYRKREDAHARSTEIARSAAEIETANDVARIRSLEEAGLDAFENRKQSRGKRMIGKPRDQDGCDDNEMLILAFRRLLEGNDGDGSNEEHED